ncbi:MAG: hypothetical protein WC458_00235 [Patescibacteria group bacterium]
MNLFKKLKINRLLISFCGYVLVILAIVAPWLLHSGYLFLTDMAWGMNINLDWTNVWFLFNLIIKGLSFIFSIAFLEKIFITGVLFLILLGGRFFVKTVLARDWLESATGGPVSSRGLVFVLSLFALFNPFVYDRALYGQFSVLIAYGCLLFAGAYLFKAWQTLDFKNLRLAAVFSALVLLSALHFIFFLALFYLLFFILLFLKRREMIILKSIKKFWLALLFSLVIVLLINANWLVALIFKASPLTSFVQQGITTQDLSAFQTAGKDGTETFTNVLLMSGFWGKEQFRYFDLTDAPGWQRSFILLTPLIFYGVYLSFRKRSRDEKIFSAGLIFIFSLAVSLAVGIKSPLTGGLTMFLYDHLPLYKGLREPQKLVAVIIPIYLFYLTLGVNRLKDFKLVKSHRRLSAVVLAVIIVTQTPSLLWGFNNQVKSTPYPADWYEVNSFLVNRATQSYSCSDKILFLPWHMYLSFNWAGKVIANPAPVFFTCPVISGTNMEYGGIYDNSQNYDSAAVAAWLRVQGKDGSPVPAGSPIRYIILAKEVDWKKYGWLNDLSYLRLIKETATLLVYEIKS